MKSVFAFGASFAGSALVFVIPLFALSACSSNKTQATPAPDYGPQVKCDETQCAPGNKCLPGDGELRCRRPCSSNTDSTTNCPAGATCVAASSPSTIPPACARATDEASAPICAAFGTGGGVRLHAFTCGDAVPKNCVATATAGTWCCSEAVAEVYATPFCVKNLATITAGPKQWGNACNATGGLDNNPDCDSAQGFFCYGTSPADGASYCTRYDCHSDRECAPGFYCGTINVGPDVTTAKATLHETRTACLRRDYCAPCSADFDCPMLNNLPQHCVPDDNNVGFCAPECKATDNCPKDAKCVDGGIGIKTCYPRAGTCVGDGSLCSPCRNDADCGDDGACVRGQYTTERSCAKKSAITCKAGAVAGTDFQCPASANPKATIRCRGDVFDQVPKDYCHGLYPFVDSADVGCWTPAKL